MTAPKARPGIAMHVGIVCLSFRDGTPNKYFWWASEDQNLDQEKIVAMAKRNGPFDSAEQAEQAAQTAIGITPDCEIEHGGMWNPKWSKPH
jgi:hypothetical protein